ncbi:MAG: hypothetical protein VX405_00855 [Myxococcota bacterium]|jgi:hypothetical protein|nr:hypothetical protein [Myxococcales bacterium]MBF95216.1 hypothetical protein [Myxococcales bacterium]MEC7750033.1 hypothetical protein [Myxococcota bacterium]HBU48740.1 hypothetical protein [Myxococcales bacterium]|tara:strand:+ start:499 stop:978 length:480 start_codon:yes stop_codon:yes gene_type:complete
MSDEYRLETLLKLRTRAREAAEQELALKRQAEAKAKNQLEIAIQLKEDHEDLIRRGREELYDGAEVTIGLLQQRDAVLQARSLELEGLNQKVEQAEIALKSAQSATATALAEMTQARQDEEALIKHKENWAHEQKVVSDRREEDAADDIAQTTWRNRKP